MGSEISNPYLIFIPKWKVVLNYEISSGMHRSHKIRQHCRQKNTHTRARTHLRTHGNYIISLLIFKRKVNYGSNEWFKIMTNLIRECVGVVAHLSRVWKTEFHFNQGLLPISIQRFSLFTSAKSRRRRKWWLLNVTRSLTACPQQLDLNNIYILMMTKIIIMNFVLK